MKCPYCNQEMEKGYIYNPRMAVCWYPDDEEPGIMVFSKPENGVKLSKMPFLSGARAISHYCRECDKIVIDPKESFPPKVKYRKKEDL